MTRMVWPAFTLIELLTVIAIIGILAASSVPSFRGLQARQALKSAQQGIQAMVYQVQQLTLAPSVQTNGGADYDVVGYGLYVGQRSTTFFDCTISTSHDFVGIVKFIRFHDANASIMPVPNFATPTSGNQTGCLPTVNADQDTNDFYVLPPNLDFQDTRSPLPILVGHSVAAAGNSVNPLPNVDGTAVSSGPINLVIEDPKIQVGSPRAPISRTVNLDLTGAAK